MYVATGLTLWFINTYLVLVYGLIVSLLLQSLANPSQAALRLYCPHMVHHSCYQATSCPLSVRWTDWHGPVQCATHPLETQFVHALNCIIVVDHVDAPQIRVASWLCRQDQHYSPLT